MFASECGRKMTSQNPHYTNETKNGTSECAVATVIKGGRNEITSKGQQQEVGTRSRYGDTF